MAFASGRDGGGYYRIYVLDLEARRTIRLTDGREDVQPAWSPDGQRIAYRSNNEIYVVRADGTEATRVTHHPGRDSAPTWSPDGSRIAFISDRDGDPEIFVNADGSGLRQLTSIGVLDHEPAWSAARRLFSCLHHSANPSCDHLCDH